MYLIFLKHYEQHYFRILAGSQMKSVANSRSELCSGFCSWLWIFIWI